MAYDGPRQTGAFAWFSTRLEAREVTEHLFYGRRFTILKDRHKEISKGLLKGMCSDLGINPQDRQ